jgi:hypothetical protein
VKHFTWLASLIAANGVSDINMPGMSGLEFLPKAKAARPDVPFQGERPSGPTFIIWSIPTKRTPADAAGKAGDADEGRHARRPSLFRRLSDVDRAGDVHIAGH